MVEKFEKDGKVAVLISVGWGAGWSTWNDRRIAIDKRVIEKFLSGCTEEEMKNFLDEIGYTDTYMGGYKDIIIEWIEKGKLFRVAEYDGSEYISCFERDSYFEA